jgi:hypothetical protein
MTTLGHSLTAISIAVLTLPRGRSLIWYLVTGHLFIFFANLPDFPFPGWGHDAYQISHSIFLALLFASLMPLLLLSPRFKAQVGLIVVVAWSVAWLTHMLLDSTYSHGNGIGIFWPLSDAHLALPISWFETLSWPPVTGHNMRVFAIEAVVYGAFLVLCLIVRRTSDRRATVSGGDAKTASMTTRIVGNDEIDC